MRRREKLENSDPVNSSDLALGFPSSDPGEQTSLCIYREKGGLRFSGEEIEKSIHVIQCRTKLHVFIELQRTETFTPKA